MKTVAFTVDNGLCCSCGICKGICPQTSIFYRLEHGLYLPDINSATCVECGLCTAVCPGLKHSYETMSSAEATVTGPIKATYNAWSRDPELRHVSASGGVISTIIRKLLEAKMYDGAFCLDSYDYREPLKTRLYTSDEVTTCWNQSNAPKSRYLPVSHENALAYMKANRKSRIILVGTSCAVRGLQSAIHKLNLKREQYLFIGLFCDKVFNYNVISYWQDRYCSGQPLTALHFKNKESGGWPGDMKFFPQDRAPFYVPLADRAGAKAYFTPERCLYCVDKLNACADLSLGDNYTGKDESELGSNSVIIRTEAGVAAWNAAINELEIRDISIRDIQNAQAVDLRLNNLYFGDLLAAQIGKDFDLNPGVPREQDPDSYQSSRNTALQKLRASAVYDSDPTQLRRQIKKDTRKPCIIIRVVRRCCRYLKRILK